MTILKLFPKLFIIILVIKSLKGKIKFRKARHLKIHQILANIMKIKVFI